MFLLVLWNLVIWGCFFGGKNLESCNLCEVVVLVGEELFWAQIEVLRKECACFCCSYCSKDLT